MIRHAHISLRIIIWINPKFNMFFVVRMGPINFMAILFYPVSYHNIVYQQTWCVAKNGFLPLHLNSQLVQGNTFHWLQCCLKRKKFTFYSGLRWYFWKSQYIPVLYILQRLQYRCNSLTRECSAQLNTGICNVTD